MSSIKKYIRTALSIVLGERCVVCGTFLPGAGLCPRCLLQLPYINIRGAAGNPIERVFWGVLPVERASSMLFYQPHNIVETLLHNIKYGGRSDLGVLLGRQMAQELLPTGFFDGIDGLQPVPLHPNRERTRGFNQSERIVRGVAEVTGLPIVDYVRRVVDNPSQTQLSHAERHANVKDIFAANTPAVERDQPRHILFVDDVITTGSTIVSCAKSLCSTLDSDQPSPIRVSVLSLAYAGKLHLGVQREDDLHLPSMVVDNTEFRERQITPLA